MKLTKQILREMIEDVMNEGKPPGMSSAEFHKKVIYKIMNPPGKKSSKRPIDTKSPFRDRKTAAATDKLNPVKEGADQGREADQIEKQLKGWISAAEINERIREKYKESSEYRKGGYKGDPMGTDQFFKKYYVGKSFKLEFLSRFYFDKANSFQNKYKNVADAVGLAATDILMERMPELKELSDWAMTAGTKETQRVYPNTRNIPAFRVRPDVLYYAKAIMSGDAAKEAQFKEILQASIDNANQLRDSDFDYEGKAPADWKGYTPRES
mgnify:CR=1 FL=1|tara:strand:+ start:1205 stop:2008 length:804 start_codon:yes stop_codon:yes gene_type:complete